MRVLRPRHVTTCLAILGCANFLDVAGATGSTQLVSRTASDAAANGVSQGPAISADGRFVAYSSTATNIVPGDTNGGFHDVFVFEVATGQTRIASLDAAGIQGNQSSAWPAISADGRWVAFLSIATNLVGGDTNGKQDVFVKDLLTNAIERVSVSTAGAQADGDSTICVVSWDGRFVAFASAASNLVANDSNGQFDVFLRDRMLGTTTLVSVDSSGVPGSSASGVVVDEPGLAISADGRRVAFLSLAPNLVGNDTNGAPDVFVRDLLAGTTLRVDVGPSGAQSSGVWSYGFGNLVAISADGNCVAFVSQANDLVANDGNGASDVFVRDIRGGNTERVSVGPAGEQANGDSWAPSLSADGRHVTFATRALNFGPPTPFAWQTLWVRDRMLQTSEISAFAPDGTPVRSIAFSAQLSADGRHVAFDDYHALVNTDQNTQVDVYLSDRDTSAMRTFCAGDGSAVACPCGNVGAPGHGCDNSFATGGGLLVASGTPSVSADSVTMTVTDLPATASALFFQGTVPLHAGGGSVFGDGVRCVGGYVTRIRTRTAVAGSMAFGAGAGDPPISVTGAVPFTGGSRWYQVWYRNSATFCTSAPFNLTNGVEVIWHL